QITRAKRPAIFEIESVSQAREKVSGVSVIVAGIKRFRVVGNASGMFELVNLVTESLEADNVVHMLPDHARDGAGAHEAHNDDALALHCEENTEPWVIGMSSQSRRDYPRRRNSRARFSSRPRRQRRRNFLRW